MPEVEMGLHDLMFVKLETAEDISVRVAKVVSKALATAVSSKQGPGSAIMGDVEGDIVIVSSRPVESSIGRSVTMNGGSGNFASGTVKILVDETSGSNADELVSEKLEVP